MALTESQFAFMRDNPFVGVVTTLRPDGSPHSTVVWVDVDDDGVSFNTARGRVKPNNIESDPRIALTVVNPENTYQWVSITGTASLTDEGADGQIDRLAKKYLGQDSYPWRQESEQRVSVRIAVGRVSAVGFDA